MQQFGTFVMNHWELFLALAVILALILRNSFSGSKNVDPSEATRLINQEDALILDVRENAEVKEGKILNAVHIPLGALPQRLNELEKHKSRTIVVNCRSGARSARACGILRKAGFESVYNLQGGIMAWQSANLPLSKKR